MVAVKVGKYSKARICAPPYDLEIEAYVYDGQGRRSYSADEEGKVTKYEYDSQSRLITVLYSWTREKAEADRKEAEEAGLYFTPDRGNGERYTILPAEMAALRAALNRAAPLRGNAIAQSQMMWRETYTYDLNGNRSTKTTPWGTIEYEYDAENRLMRRGDIVYTNDMDGNVLGERGLRYEAYYEYNGQNRMTYSEVTSHAGRTHAVSFYAYDALGRRTTTESITGQMLRTVYDGMGFEAIREGETFRNGSLTTQFATSEGTRVAQGGGTAGERYRWISDDYNGGNTSADGYSVEESRYGGRGVTLYGNGEAVAVSYSSSTSSRSVYLGKDILGSVRTATADGGAVEDRYEYDAFGQAYMGDLSGGMNLGYTGKPYDAGTGLYNYGYRDYRPQAARFTTADPIRDGNNWYAYVNNDPVNYIDLWGLETYSYEVSQTLTTSSYVGNTLFHHSVEYSATYYSTDYVLLNNFRNDQNAGRVDLPWSQESGTGRAPSYSLVDNSGSVPSGVSDFLFVNGDTIVEYYYDGERLKREVIKKNNGVWCRNIW